MDIKRQMMKKFVLAGIVMLMGYLAGAQVFKKGDIVEIDKNLSANGNYSWITGNVVEVDLERKQYVVRSKEKKVYNIPFIKEDAWMRRPTQTLSSALALKNESGSCTPTFELVKQKIQEEFESDFSEYDSVSITYNSIEALPVYKNTDASFGRPDSDIFPFNVDFTVRLVSTNSDGSQKKMNWQFKRKYLLHQSLRGKCSLSMAEKEESLLSHI